MGTRISLCAYTPSPLNNQDLVTTTDISLSVNESEFELIKPHVVYSGIMLGMCRTESPHLYLLLGIILNWMLKIHLFKIYVPKFSDLKNSCLDQRSSTADKVLAVHAADLDSTPSTIGSSEPSQEWSPNTGRCPDHRQLEAPNKQKIFLLGVGGGDGGGEMGWATLSGSQEGYFSLCAQETTGVWTSMEANTAICEVSAWPPALYLSFSGLIFQC